MKYLLLLLILTIPVAAIPNPCPAFCNYPKYAKAGICLSGQCAVFKSVQPVCYEKWVCSGWSPCIKNWQTRTCNEVNCGTSKYKPYTMRACTAHYTNGGIAYTIR